LEALRNDKQTIGLIAEFGFRKVVEFGDHELDTWLFFDIFNS
jgi:hypothetical protein